jgi:hypothetical protein
MTMPHAGVWNAPVAQPIATSAPTSSYRDSYAWSLVKHAALLGVLAAAITFVFEAGRSPMLSLAYAASSLVFLAVVALVDRQRFEAAGRFSYEAPTMTIPGHARTWHVAAPVEWQPTRQAPPVATPQQHVPLSPAQQLAPLAYDLSVALMAPVDVT